MRDIILSKVDSAYIAFTDIDHNLKIVLNTLSKTKTEKAKDKVVDDFTAGDTIKKE